MMRSPIRSGPSRPRPSVRRSGRALLMKRADDAIGRTASVADPVGRDTLPGDTADTRWWLAFRLADLTSTARYKALLDHFGSLEQAWRANSKDLRRVLGNRDRLLDALSAAQKAIDPERE